MPMKTIRLIPLLAALTLAFAATLNGLIDDGEKRRALGEAAFCYARENLSPAVCYRPLLDAINNVGNSAE